MAAKNSNIISVGYEINTSRELGKGSYGYVYEALDKDGKKSAVKIIETEDAKKFNSATNEYSALMNVQAHPNLIKNLGLFNEYNQNKIYIFLEYCAGGNLHDYVAKVHPNLDKKLDIMCQCADAIAFLHGLPEPIIHRDIKPANILMTEPNVKGIVKVADFGVAKIMDPEKNYVTEVEGTIGYLAPEIFLRKKYTKSVDVFAMGLVYMALLRYEGKQDSLNPISDDHMEKGLMGIPVGGHMASVHTSMGAEKSKECKIIEIKKTDSAIERNLKELINQMASFDKKDRPHMAEVYDELKQIETSTTPKEDDFYTDDSDTDSLNDTVLSYIPPEQASLCIEEEKLYMYEAFGDSDDDDLTLDNPYLLTDTGYDTLKFKEVLQIGKKSKDKKSKWTQ